MVLPFKLKKWIQIFGNIITLFLSAGSDVEMRDSDLVDFLQEEWYRREVDGDDFYSPGERYNNTNPINFTPLTMGAFGADLKARDACGRTALGIAAESGPERAFVLLLKAHHNIQRCCRTSA